MRKIDPLNGVSLRVQSLFQETVLSDATGFVVKQQDTHFLITNWHVVTGRHAKTGNLLSASAAVPNKIRIFHHSSRVFNEWVIIDEPLETSEKLHWIVHPNHSDSNIIDVVAVPLSNINSQVTINPLDLTLSDTRNVAVQPSMAVSIIGYPHGLSVEGGWPIWKTGHIASDPVLNYDGKNMFLIDASTRGGMSGSPVILRSMGSYLTKQGDFSFGTGIVDIFLGVYASRTEMPHGREKDLSSDIGMVWKPNLINEILTSAKTL